MRPTMKGHRSDRMSPYYPYIINIGILKPALKIVNLFVLNNVLEGIYLQVI